MLGKHYDILQSNKSSPRQGRISYSGLSSAFFFSFSTCLGVQKNPSSHSWQSVLSNTNGTSRVSMRQQFKRWLIECCSDGKFCAFSNSCIFSSTLSIKISKLPRAVSLVLLISLAPIKEKTSSADSGRIQNYQVRVSYTLACTDTSESVLPAPNIHFRLLELSTTVDSPSWYHCMCQSICIVLTVSSYSLNTLFRKASLLSAAPIVWWV